MSMVWQNIESIGLKEVKQADESKIHSSTWNRVIQDCPHFFIKMKFPEILAEVQVLICI